MIHNLNYTYMYPNEKMIHAFRVQSGIVLQKIQQYNCNIVFCANNSARNVRMRSVSHQKQNYIIKPDINR